MKASCLSQVSFILLIIIVGAATDAAVSGVRVGETRNLKCHPVDLAALNGFQNCIELPIGNWGAADAKCCSWTGVTCGIPRGDVEQAARVVRMDLSGRSLNGQLSDPLADLDRLIFLILSGNQLGDALPPKFFQMRNLEVLDLSGNQFTGYFPVITDLPAIRVLDV